MTIKRRLFWCNILMIMVPVLSTILTGALCAVFIWISLIASPGPELRDQEDFDHACMALTELIEHKLKGNSDFSSVEALLENQGMALRIVSEGKDVFQYGEENPNDAALLSAAERLEDTSTVTCGGRSLYAQKETIGSREYRVYLFGSYYGRQTYSELQIAMALSAAAIALAILLSILLTNRFLIKFVFNKIEEPLDILTSGVHQIRDGNLKHRIQYERRDEFLPVCADFNEMAARLQQSVERQQQQDQSRRELIAGISHDIRSPLTSIQAYVEGLLDGVARTPQSQQAYLQTIKKKAEDLAHIISQLFLFSKMELGEYPENPCMLRLDESIAESAAAAEEEFAQKGMTIHMRLEPAEIYGDPVYLRRIVMNILENSLKYKTKEEGNIWILLTRTEAGCRLLFSDDGPGVPEESLPHLFEVFYRSDPARQNPGSGSGLGLAIVANAVQRMGGKIQAFSGKDCGLELCIDFPCEVREDDENTDY